MYALLQLYDAMMNKDFVLPLYKEKTYYGSKLRAPPFFFCILTRQVGLGEAKIHNYWPFTTCALPFAHHRGIVWGILFICKLELG